MPPAGRPLEPLLAVAAAFTIGVYGPSAPAVAAGAALVLAATLAGTGRRPLAYVALAAAAVGFLVTVTIVPAHERARRAVAASLGAPRRCEGEGIVARSVTLHAAADPAGPPAYRVPVAVTALTCEGRAVEGLPGGAAIANLFVDEPLAPPLRRADRIDFVADLAVPTRFLEHEIQDPRYAEAASGALLSGGAHEVRLLHRPWLGGRIDGAREHVRARIRSTFPPGAEALARALVLGENDLPADEDAAFRDAGLSHLLAVSGMHIVLVVASLVAALTYLLARVPPLAARYDTRRLAAACGAPLAIAYADFSGGSGSAVRAAATASLAYALQALGRRAPPLRHLAFAPLLLAPARPLLVTDVSFQLSLAATFGLLVFARPLDGLVARLAPRLPSALRGALTTTLAATIPTTPLLARLGGRLPLLAIPLNVLAVPVGEIAALPLCLVHALAAPVPALERGLALAGGGALRLLSPLAALGARAPGLAIPPPTPLQGAALLLLALLGAASFAGGRAPRFAAPAAVALALVVAGAEIRVRAARAPGALVVTALDVGQGDATLVTLPDGRAILIDGGGFVGSPVDPGAPIAAVLAAQRRDRLAAVVLSHPHPDHFGGLRRATAGLAVDRFFTVTTAKDEPPPVAELRRTWEAAGARTYGPRSLCGFHDLGGGVALRVLSPCPKVHDRWSTNDNSLVLQFLTAEGRALLVGDAEGAAEEELLARYGASLQSDLLKVGHHGSRTSSSAPFLAAVAPRVATASTGLRNRFGHPHPRTVARFAAAEIPLAITARLGAVRVVVGAREVHAAAEGPLDGGDL